jgi:N-acetylglucosamine-6-phosphate deacetylase
MAESVVNTVRFTGMPMDDVLPMASTVPATYTGIELDGTVSADWNPERLELQIIDVVSNARGAHTSC